MLMQLAKSLVLVGFERHLTVSRGPTFERRTAATAEMGKTA
jgi:hypothetical protein